MTSSTQNDERNIFGHQKPGTAFETNFKLSRKLAAGANGGKTGGGVGL